MTKTYQIVSMKRDTAAGKNIIRATLAINDPVEGPQEIGNVTIWDGFPNFASLKVSDPVEGEIVEKQKGQYVNRSLYGSKKVASPKADIGKAMEAKAKNIEQAQDRKADSIKLAGCNRDATLMVAQELAQMTSLGHEWLQVDAQRKWKEWQAYFMKNYGDGVPFV